MTGTVTIDSLQRRIAAVGHDTEAYKATDDVYGALPACCLSPERRNHTLTTPLRRDR